MVSTKSRSAALRTGLTLAVAALTVASCSSPDDPRLGEEGRVRFVGGSGCSSSTTLAVGATVSLRLESATEDPLGGELGVSSSAPSIIDAHMGLEPSSVVLHASKEGQARIAILSDGDEIDGLTFGASPAGVAKHQTVTDVVAGGAVDVHVTDVFGDCGSDDCRLLGDGFLAWRVEPSDLGAFVLDADGLATFRAKAEGSVHFIGTEPARSRDLVDAPIVVHAATEVTDLAATLRTIELDPDKKTTGITLPGSVTRPDAFALTLIATVDGAFAPVSRRDILWRVEGAEIVVQADRDDPNDPLATVFLTAGKGKTTLVASAPFLTMDKKFELELK